MPYQDEPTYHVRCHMTARAKLADLISRPALEELAGDRSFERGLAYFRDGAVERLVCHDNRVTARVVGTDKYTVKLWPDGRRLDRSCTCPMGQDGGFCKHLVATGLAWLAIGSGKRKQPAPEIEVIRKFLEASDKQTLVDMLTERACEDEDLADRLLLTAQRRGLSDSGAVRNAIRRVFATREFVDYRDMPKLAARAASVPELLRELSKRDAKVAIELSSDAMKRGLALLAHCDDSDGRLGDILSDIAGIHYEAFGRGGLAPPALAENLFELQLADGYDFFALGHYLPSLGKDGLAAYRKLALDAWKRVPALAPGARAERHAGRRDELAGIMKTLAAMDGDVDALVGVLKRDLADSYAYLEIATVLQKAGRHDEALKWAEDGRRAFAREAGDGLDNFLVAEYHRRGRHDDAIGLRWARFTKNLDVRSYQELKRSADGAGSWSAWREKALSAVRKSLGGKKPVPNVPYWIAGGASLLVEIFLWEDDPAAALGEARTHGCARHLWLKTAKALESSHPDEAVAIYQDQIGPIVNLTNNQAYDQAVDLLRRMRALMVRTGKSAKFGPYLNSLRIKHKAKRNFMRRLKSIAAEKAGARSEGSDIIRPGEPGS